MSRPRLKPIVYDLNKDYFFTEKVSTNTLDEKPDVVFLRAKTRITPSVMCKTYESDILHLKNEFEKYSRELLDNSKHYEKNYIFSIDLAEKSVKFKKTSHLHYDVFLKSKEKETLLTHRNRLKKLSDKMDNKLIKLFKKYNLIWK